MWIIGCDFHSGFQQLAIFDNQSGEIEEKKLLHPGEAREFYRGLQGEVRVGMESGCPCQWFRQLLEECGHQLWIGDAARIRAAETRQQKTDRRDAELILRLLLEGRFPRIWVPTEAERDLRQLLLDRHHRMRLRTKVKNQLQALALNQGVQKGRRLWSLEGRQQLQALPMLEHAGRRRDQLLKSLTELDAQILALDVVVRREAEGREEARRLMTHPGVGPQTALGMVLTVGEVNRFASEQAGGQLSGADPARAQLGRQAAAGTHQQTGIQLYALPAGGSGPDGGARR